MKKEKAKLTIAIIVLLIVCIFSIGVVILTIHRSNIIVNDARNDYYLNKNLIL